MPNVSPKKTSDLSDLIELPPGLACSSDADSEAASSDIESLCVGAVAASSSGQSSAKALPLFAKELQDGISFLVNSASDAANLLKPCADLFGQIDTHWAEAQKCAKASNTLAKVHTDAITKEIAPKFKAHCREIKKILQKVSKEKPRLERCAKFGKHLSCFSSSSRELYNSAVRSLNNCSQQLEELQSRGERILMQMAIWKGETNPRPVRANPALRAPEIFSANLSSLEALKTAQCPRCGDALVLKKINV